MIRGQEPQRPLRCALRCLQCPRQAPSDAACMIRVLPLAALSTTPPKRLQLIKDKQKARAGHLLYPSPQEAPPSWVLEPHLVGGRELARTWLCSEPPHWVLASAGLNQLPGSKEEPPPLPPTQLRRGAASEDQNLPGAGAGGKGSQACFQAVITAFPSWEPQEGPRCPCVCDWAPPSPRPSPPDPETGPPGRSPGSSHSLPVI